MVNWIGQISLSLQRLRDAWMDNLPMSALSEEQRRNQYLADVAQENAERLKRDETALDPNTPENRERWNTAQVNNHESLFSFSDNLTTLMFIVASDLSEAQRERERLTRGMNITAYTFETARKVFVELFCTPKSSMEDPSLRVSGHVNSMNKTFVVEDYGEDEFAQWTKDEVTGEQGHVDDERSCFWTWDDTDCVWQPRPFKGRQVKRRKGKGKGKHKGISKGSGRAFIGEQQAQDSEMWSEDDFAWWTKGRKGKKGLSKNNDGLQKGGFRRYQPDKGARKDYSQNKGKQSSKKEKARKKLIRNPDFQPLKHLKKKNLMTCLPVSGLLILGLQLPGGIARKLTLLGWRYPL